MSQPLEEKINAWTRDKSFGPLIQEVNGKVLLLEQELFEEYEPTRGPYPSFRTRLAAWLDNIVDESSQRSLFQLVPHLFFLGPRELEVLYRVAFHTQIARWLIDQIGLTFDQASPENSLQQAVARSWFCPITDSMRINAFYHLNHISGRDFRPDWRSLRQFGSEDKIRRYLTDQGIDRIVLLEDFIGSGDQMKKAVEFAVTFGTPVLVVPLVICPIGAQVGQLLSSQNPTVTFSPVISLQEAAFITAAARPNEEPLFGELRLIAIDMFNGLPADEQVDVYTAFGFRGTGSLVVMYTNCPDNTLPLVHHNSAAWKPLFPRASRL
jgi:hypothetical protein